MEIETHYIEVSKTARYITYGKLSASTKYFWFALHGSKMLAEQMIYKFENFDPLEHFVVAPEALNRFYDKGFGGEVVASWMTKRDRLQEIANFSNYLSRLYGHFVLQLSRECVKTIMGFSQGGTTVLRWLHASHEEVDWLLAYSCWIPEDIDLIESKTDLSMAQIIYTYGEQDQYLNQETIAKLKEVIERNNLKLVMEPYKGDHRVDRQQLLSMFNKFIELKGA